MSIGILGTGIYLPDRVIDNCLVARWTGKPESWIEARTGIVERRDAVDGTTTSDLAHRAVDDLLDRVPGALTGLTAIVLATSTPDQPQPATAALLQDRLGIPAVPAFDLNSVCAGFLFALTVGAALGSTGAGTGRVLVVGADIYSTIMDRKDPTTVTLFGDGAGAVLLGPVPDGFGLHAQRLVTHGQLRDLVEVSAGGTRQPLDHVARDQGLHLFRMQGHAVRRYVLDVLPDLVHGVLGEAGMSLDSIDRVILHQANPRLLEALAADLGIDIDRVTLTAPRFGNTGAASVPITLRAADQAKPLQRGERILFAAVGGGMSAGAAVLTWY